MRGTFAGRYVDADDELEFIGAKTAEGAIAGGAVWRLFAGLLGSPSGWSEAELVGGVAQERTPRICAARSSTRSAERSPRGRRP